MILVSIIGVWVTWMLLSAIGLAAGIFVAVGNGDRTPSGPYDSSASLSDIINNVVGSALTIYTLIGLFAVAIMNLLYLSRYWDQLPVKRKALSGLLLSVTSLPFLIMIYGLLTRFIPGIAV